MEVFRLNCGSIGKILSIIQQTAVAMTRWFNLLRCFSPAPQRYWTIPQNAFRILLRSWAGKVCLTSPGRRGATEGRVGQQSDDPFGSNRPNGCRHPSVRSGFFESAIPDLQISRTRSVRVVTPRPAYGDPQWHYGKGSKECGAHHLRRPCLRRDPDTTAKLSWGRAPGES